MAEDQQYVSVAYRPEVGAGTAISQPCKPVSFHEGMQVLPVFQVFGAELEIGSKMPAVGKVRQNADGEGVVGIVLFPNAGIADPVWQRGLVVGSI